MHWEAWDVENLPGLTDRLKVAEMVRWWGRSMIQKSNDGIAVYGLGGPK